MLFRQDVLRRIARGEVTLAFRRWRKPTVRAGGTLRTALGVLSIDALSAIEPRAISEQDAAQAGYEDRGALLRELRGEGTLYRIAISLAGPDPRISLRARALDSRDELTLVRDKLQAMDRRALSGPWTLATLRLLRDHSGVRAAELAGSLALETEQFKRNVRKLKDLGLTESLELGYRLSARGQSLLAAL